MRYLHAADWHFHTHKNQQVRLDHGIAAMRWAFQSARDRGIKHLLFAGDVFQDRQRIHTLVYDRVFRALVEELAIDPELKLYVLLGNHDMWFLDRWDVSSIYPLSCLPNVTVIDAPQTLDVGGCRVDFLPYCRDPIATIDEHFGSRRSDLLVGHVAVHGAKLHMLGATAEVGVEHDGDMTLIDETTFAGWKKVYLGHYHLAQTLGVVEYVGSSYQLNFGEAHQEKHLIASDPDGGNQEYIVNSFSPRHYIVNSGQLEKGGYDGHFVKVEVEDAGAVDLREVRRAAGAVATIEVREKKTEAPPDPEKATFDLAEGSILERWVKATGVTELDHGELLRTGQSVIDEAR